MRTQKVVPLVGIVVCLFLTLLSVLQSRQTAVQRRDDVAPALPEVTSATQPMTVDELHLRLKRAMDASAPGRYVLDVDKDTNTITIDQWADGFNADAANAALRSKEYLLKWNVTLENARDLGDQIQTIVSSHGHPEISVIYRLVNDDDHGQIFAVIERGELAYDVVADTPPGEQVPDPASRVAPTETESEMGTYVVNTASGVFHSASCAYAAQIADYNRASFTGDRADLIAQGFRLCEICSP